MHNDDAPIRWLHAQEITVRDNDKGDCGVNVGTRKVSCRKNEPLNIVSQC